MVPLQELQLTFAARSFLYCGRNSQPRQDNDLIEL
jgi:hypothetical protein